MKNGILHFLIAFAVFATLLSVQVYFNWPWWIMPLAFVLWLGWGLNRTRLLKKRSKEKNKTPS